MKKTLITTITFYFFVLSANAQNARFLDKNESETVVRNQITERQTFPTVYQLVLIDLVDLKQQLLSAPERFSGKDGVIISLPNADGFFEYFNVYEYSNFSQELQRQVPGIRSYFAVNKKNNTVLRMSLGTNGISFINFRENETEYLEPYSQDLSVYAVYKTSRLVRELPMSCTTADHDVAHDLIHNTSNKVFSSSPELLTFRLALSCTGEYGASFGGTFNTVLSQMNTTITNVNAVFEKDLGIRMNIIQNNNLVMYYNASTDPYSSGSVGTQNGVWNNELQATLNSQLGLDAFDVGHLFGATGGGGNAGCIGCVCLPNKGRAYTSPDSGPASGPRFDIDYVAHEFGHQFGGRHTFSYGGFGAPNSVELSDASLEVGSGSTIMAYAGITAYDIVNASSPYFHGFSIDQIQANMVGKTCPVRTPKNNVAPMVSAGLDYTIPFGTPFILTGTAIDANANDALTYCWEQNDAGTQDEILANSTASPFKQNGPNFRSYSPTTNNFRYFPILARTIANQKNTVGLDANMLSESLLDTPRSLNFMLTVRDNSVNGGLTKRDDMVLNVTGAAGPFEVTAPNTSLSWTVGTNQTVTWSVAGTTVNNVNAKFVDIYLSIDGGNTYPTLLAAKVPNDGSETIVVPNNVGNTNRIMVRGFEHVFFDISNANFAITAPSSSFAIKTPATVGSQNKSACQGANLVYSLIYETYGGFAAATSFTTTGLPTGLTATFAPTTLSANGTTTLTISNTASFTPGQYGFSVTASSGATSRTFPLYLEIINGTFSTQTLTAPADNAQAQPVVTTLSWNAVSNATLYNVQIATNAAFTTNVTTNTVSTTSFNATLQEATQYFWRVLPRNLGCDGSFSTARTFTTGATVCNTTSNATAVIIAATGTPTVTSTINIPAGTLITDVNVSLNLTHTNVNDLTIMLTDPSGTSVFLVANPCAAGNQNIVTTFDDEAASSFTCTAGSFFTPTTPLNAFDTANATGNWVLEIADGASGNGGTLNSWALNICGFQALSNNSSNAISNFVLYPNPNNGNFIVQFDADADSKTKIEVFDIGGRSVFSNSYNNTSTFSQQINLQSLSSGIYMINIQNGDRQLTKKFIKE